MRAWLLLPLVASCRIVAGNPQRPFDRRDDASPTITLFPGLPSNNSAQACDGCTIHVPEATLDWWYSANLSYISAWIRSDDSAQTYSLDIQPPFDLTEALQRPYTWSRTSVYNTLISKSAFSYVPQYYAPPIAASTSFISKSYNAPVPTTGPIPAHLGRYFSAKPGIPTLAVTDQTGAGFVITAPTPYVYYSKYEVESKFKVTDLNGRVRCSSSTATFDLAAATGFPFDGQPPDGQSVVRHGLPASLAAQVEQPTCVVGSWKASPTVLVIVNVFYEVPRDPYFIHTESSEISLDVPTLAPNTYTATHLGQGAIPSSLASHGGGDGGGGGDGDGGGDGGGEGGDGSGTDGPKGHSGDPETGGGNQSEGNDANSDPQSSQQSNGASGHGHGHGNGHGGGEADNQGSGHGTHDGDAANGNEGNPDYGHGGNGNGHEDDGNGSGASVIPETGSGDGPEAGSNSGNAGSNGGSGNADESPVHGLGNTESHGSGSISGPGHGGSSTDESPNAGLDGHHHDSHDSSGADHEHGAAGSSDPVQGGSGDAGSGGIPAQAGHEGSGAAPTDLEGGRSPSVVEVPPPLITIGSEVYTPNAATQYSITSGQILTPGGTVEVDGTVVSLGPSASAVVVADSVAKLTPNPPFTTAAPTLMFGASTVRALPHQGPEGPTYVILGRTLTPGGRITVRGTTLSLGEGATALVVDGYTQLLALPAPTRPPATLSFDGSMYTAASKPGSDGPTFLIDGQTLTPGGAITVHGTTLSLSPDASAAVIDGSLHTLNPTPASGAVTTRPPTLPFDGTTYTANAGTTFAISGRTLTPGGVITVHGTRISLASSATAVVVNGKTTPLYPATQVAKATGPLETGGAGIPTLTTGDGQPSTTSGIARPRLLDGGMLGIAGPVAMLGVLLGMG